MNSPGIQYARSADGVRIAYSVTGAGPPFVVAPDPYASMDVAWRLPEYRTFFEELGETHTVVRYDSRGSGASDREATNFSLPAVVADLEAVVERLGLEQFALFGMLHACPAAIVYAAENPQRVSRLVLWHAYRDHADLSVTPQFEAVRGLMSTDWQLYTETTSRAILGWEAGEPARHYARQIRETISAQSAKLHLDAIRDYDVTAYLPALKLPVLLLHRRSHERYPVEIGRKLAAEINNCRLCLVDGSGLLYYLEDPATVLNEIKAFLAEDDAPNPLSGEARTRSSQRSQPSAAIASVATPASPGSPLSPREREVAILVTGGCTNREIAERLVITEGTAILHVKHVLAKLGFRSRAQIAAWGVEQGLSSAFLRPGQKTGN